MTKPKEKVPQRRRIDWVLELRGDYYYYKHIDNGRLPYFVFAMRYAWFIVRQQVLRTVCLVRGHAWEGSSDITPDHGIEYIYCRRCGESHRHVWY